LRLLGGIVAGWLLVAVSIKRGDISEVGGIVAGVRRFARFGLITFNHGRHEWDREHLWLVVDFAGGIGGGGRRIIDVWDDRLATGRHPHLGLAQAEEVAAIAAQGKTGSLDHGDVPRRHIPTGHRAQHVMEIGMWRTDGRNRRQTALGKQLAQARLRPRRGSGIAQLEHPTREGAQTFQHTGQGPLLAIQTRTWLARRRLSLPRSLRADRGSLIALLAAIIATATAIVPAFAAIIATATTVVPAFAAIIATATAIVPAFAAIIATATAIVPARATIVPARTTIVATFTALITAAIRLRITAIAATVALPGLGTIAPVGLRLVIMIIALRLGRRIRGRSGRHHLAIPRSRSRGRSRPLGGNGVTVGGLILTGRTGARTLSVSTATTAATAATATTWLTGERIDGRRPTRFARHAGGEVAVVAIVILVVRRIVSGFGRGRRRGRRVGQEGDAGRIDDLGLGGGHRWHLRRCSGSRSRQRTGQHVDQILAGEATAVGDFVFTGELSQVLDGQRRKLGMVGHETSSFVRHRRRVAGRRPCATPQGAASTGTLAAGRAVADASRVGGKGALDGDRCWEQAVRSKHVRPRRCGIRPSRFGVRDAAYPPRPDAIPRVALRCAAAARRRCAARRFRPFPFR